DICEEATVRLNVGNITECEVPSIFTPNNDLVNDVFLIPCLATDRYPRNRVIIFNQWGDEVFNASPYQNDWAGIYDGNDLPAGTYYYVIDLGTDETPLSGFLVLER
ncbi:MAG: gliding motility-associated C-terminal domain-containing protein, partial [Bacteroidota bacterium]